MSRHDGRIGRRLAIYGPPGSGKTTLASRLADVLGVPQIELDALYHLPNWGVPATEEFRAKVRGVLEQANAGFTIDGNYSIVRDLVFERIETAIWLRQPFRVVYPRVCRRTLKRVTSRELLWGTNRERWRDVLGRESMFLYGITRWRPQQERLRAALGERPEQVRLFILRSDVEVEEFVARVRAEHGGLP